MASSGTPRHTRRLGPDEVGAAAEILRAGGLLAFPTETVYGLGGLARDANAVAGIYAAKGRPSFNPLIVHVAEASEIEGLGVMDDVARGLAARFWPGPLTLVLPLATGHGLAPAVTAGLGTVAVRVPAAPLARALLAEVAAPVAAPSANPSGRISPTRAAHVLAAPGDGGLDGRIDAVLDGGACAVGLESTILRTAPPVLLREGGLAAESIEAALGARLARDATPGRIAAPGQMTSHYAPGLPLRLGVTSRATRSVLLGFGAVTGDLSLSPGGDPAEAASTLFDRLHEAETLARARGAVRIDVAPVPETGLGRAVNDRLRRAAAPRS
jgi:L-threonylcarbamoyladenylate synthase